MPRRYRGDAPGTLHHVFNRGLARRTMFENRADRRVFVAHLAKSVRRGEIRVLTFCLLSTHYHLLLSSVDGQLSTAMQRIQTGYSRYFNRSRKRDGPLVRSRFGSKCVHDERYVVAVVAYIDLNAPQAGLSELPSDYEFSSAHPTWVGRRWFPERRTSSEHGFTQDDLDVIDARTRISHTFDPLDELLEMTPGSVLTWMKSKAALADGTEVGMPVCHPRHVIAAMDEAGIQAVEGERAHGTAARSLALRVGILRQLCGLTLQEIGVLIGRTKATVGKLARDHRILVATDEAFAKDAAMIGHSAWRRGPFGREP